MILLRICVIYKGELHKRNCFVTSYLGSFRGVEIYKTELSENFSRRRLFKCLKNLQNLGISFVAAHEGLFTPSLLSRFSLTAVDSTRAMASRIAEMAFLFAKRENAPFSFFIQGGSFFRVSAIALALLPHTSCVAISCADADAVCEALADACGAVILTSPTKESVGIFPSNPEALLRFGERMAGFSDFSLSLPPDFPFDIPLPLHASLISFFETLGVLNGDEAVLKFS